MDLVNSKILLLSGPDEFFVDMCLLMADTTKSCSFVLLKLWSRAQFVILYLFFRLLG